MLEAEAFGECHLRCLINSPWGEYWSKRILSNYVLIRKIPTIGQIGSVKVLRNERIRTTFLFGNDGWMADVHDQYMKQRISVNGGFHLPVKEAFDIDLLDFPNIAHEIRSAFLNNKSFALQMLIDKLGIESHLLYPGAIQSGLLHLRPIEGIIAPTMITTYSEYNEFLPENAVQFILANIDIEHPPSRPEDS